MPSVDSSEKPVTGVDRPFAVRKPREKNLRADVVEHAMAMTSPALPKPCRKRRGDGVNSVVKSRAPSRNALSAMTSSAPAG